MNSEREDEEILQEILARRGRDWVCNSLADRSSGQNSLSIFCDVGMHRLPIELAVGDYFVFSEGTIDTESDETVARHLQACCAALADHLRSRKIEEVRLFYSGHSLLPAYAKLTVYRVSHIETIDFGYFSNTGYRRVQFALRDVVSRVESR